MKKLLIVFGLGILSVVAIIGYNLAKPNLTLYPKLQGEDVELYLLKEKFNFEIAEGLLGEDTFTNITITDGDKSVNKIIAIEKLNLKQINCNKKWECPVLIISLKNFQELTAKKSLDSFEHDITPQTNQK